MEDCKEFDLTKIDISKKLKKENFKKYSKNKRLKDAKKSKFKSKIRSSNQSKSNDNYNRNNDLIESRTKLKNSKTQNIPIKQNKGKNILSHIKPNNADPFPGLASVPAEKEKIYQRGTLHTTSFKLKNKLASHQQTITKRKVKEAVTYSAKAENLLTEESGFIHTNGIETSEISQYDIVKATDITSAQKFFELKLDKFGPYKHDYTRNGRQLLIGGNKGHIATFDWQTKDLKCEINVMQTVNCVKWLHIETMFAVAQKNWTYIYDNHGMELHCLKALDSVLQLEFLPYHFLLVASNSKGYLQYLDVSIGKKVAGCGTGLGILSVMCQNPQNGIIHLGHPNGTVSLWSPNVKTPLVKLLCHGAGLRSLSVSKDGNYMASSGGDRKIKIWDLRNLKELQVYKLGNTASDINFSQQNFLAVSMGNCVEIFRNCCQVSADKPYLTHTCKESINSLQFCPFEDVLGVSSVNGFTSLIVPGSGEPNFDSLENNLFQNKKQRSNTEVKMLLEKIQPEMITMDLSALSKLNSQSIEQQIESKKRLLMPEKININFQPKHKKKGKSKSGKIEQRKQGVYFERKQEIYRNQNNKKNLENAKTPSVTKPYNPLDRFKTNKT